MRGENTLFEKALKKAIELQHPAPCVVQQPSKVVCGFLCGPRTRSGLETYNNVEDKTEAGRDSVGF